MGILELDVYDIEVEENHNFFANDICVHNSGYFNIEDLIDQTLSPSEQIDQMDKICSEILGPIIHKSNEKLAKLLNTPTIFLKMKREGLSLKGIWVAAKRYILEVWDNEGVRYEKPKIKIMGLEAVKSSTPQICRDKFKKIFDVILNKTEDDVIKYIDEFREEFYTLPFIEVSSPSSVNNLAAYSDKTSIYRKGAPMHVRGSLVFNQLLKDRKLNKKYELIQEGEKIRVCYMKVPNPFRENVIAAASNLPPELDLEKYIDYDMQFDKTFLTPLKGILDVIGYKTEHTASLNAFF